MKLGSIAVMCAMVAAMVLLGCSKPSAVGTWNGTAGTKSDIKIALTLSKDAKFRQTTQVFAHGRQNEMLATGTYTAKDGTLTLEVQSVNVNGISLPPPAQATSAYGYKVDGDTMALRQEKAKETVVLKRAKE